MAPTTQNQNTATAIITDAKQMEVISKHFPSNGTRIVFDSLDAATDALQKLLADSDNAFGLPVGIKGMVDGEVTPATEALYADSKACLGYVGARVALPDGKKTTGIKSIVIFPIPSIEALLNAPESKGVDYLNKILEKEIALVSFRNYRDAATLAEFTAGLDSAPGSVDEYLTAHQSSGGVDTTVFDECWKAFRDAIKTSMPALSKALPGKAESVKAMRSKSYALANPDAKPLEDRDLFVRILDQLIGVAEANELDPSVMVAWREGRDELDLTYSAPKKIDDFSFLDSVELNFAGDSEAEETAAE